MAPPTSAILFFLTLNEDNFNAIKTTSIGDFIHLMKQYFSPKEMESILSFIYEPDFEICSVLIGFLLVYFTLIKRCNPC